MNDKSLQHTESIIPHRLGNPGPNGMEVHKTDIGFAPGHKLR